MDEKPVVEFVEELLAFDENELPTWLHYYKENLTVAIIKYIKDKYANTSFIRMYPQTAKKAIERSFMVAEQIQQQEPLAMPIAWWAHGNYLLTREHKEAVKFYEQARENFLAAGDILSAARLAGNMVGLFAELGRPEQAEKYYQEAKTEYKKHGLDTRRFLRILEQNFGYQLHTLGRYSEALVAHNEALALAKEDDEQIAIAQIQVNRGITLGVMGWWSEVKEAFQTAFAIAIEHNQTELIARIQLNLGWYFDAIGQPTEALRYFQRAEKLFTDLNISVDVATTQLFEGHLLQRIGSLRSAIRHYNDALTQFANAGLNPMIGQAQVYMAAARRRRGQKRDFIKASELLDKAEVVWGEQKNQTWLLKVILERISIELDRNNAKSAKLLFEKLPVQSEQQYFVAEFYLLRAETLRLESGEKAYCQEVEKAYEIALDYAHKQNNLWLQRHIYVGLGRLFFDNNVAKAEQMLEEAAAIDARIRRTLSVAELKAGFHQQTNDVFSLLILLALEHGNATQVLHQTWRAKSEPFLDLLWTKKIEDSASYKEINELVWVREQLATLRYRRAMDSIDNQEYVPDSTREAEDPEIQRLTERILELRLHMNQPQNLDDEQWYNLSPETSLSMDEDILLEYVLCGEEIIGIYTNRTGQRAAMKVANEDDLLDLLDSFRFNLHHALSRPTTQQQLLLPECKEILGELYQILIAPLLNSVPFQSGNRRLLIAPCDPITLLPFSALWDGKEYLCQQWRIEMIQSGALLTLPQENEGARGESVIIASTANGKILQTAHEAKKIATLLPDSELFIDKPGTLMQLTQFTSAPKFLHIAGHTIPNNDAPIMWAFQLTDEVLSVEQSYELPLEGTELVTLSGCTTASGLENGGALLAFQSAFFVAGARRVLSSLWPIQDDTSISLWMEHFYRLLALDVTAPDALQLTQIHFLSDPFYSHPAMWAAFVCARR